MTHVVLERSYQPAISVPITAKNWIAINHPLDSCLEVREVDWVYSFVAQDGSRSICEFAAPYAEAVRESCRESRMPFDRVWSSEIWITGQQTNPIEDKEPIVVEVTFDLPVTQEMCDTNKKQAEGCLSELGVFPTYSLVSMDGRRSICFFWASSAEDVRSLYRKVGMPFDRIWRAKLITPCDCQ